MFAAKQKGLIVDVSKVEYSTLRDGCVALVTISDGPKGALKEYWVVDLPSNKSLSISMCLAPKGYMCVDPKPLMLEEHAFTQAMETNGDLPLAPMYVTPKRPHDTSLYIKRPK
jgi:hypothetical protein